MPTASEYATILQLLVLLAASQTQQQRTTLIASLAGHGYFYGDGGANMSGTAEVNVISANKTATTDGGVLDISGTAIVRRVYKDRQCERTGHPKRFGCKISFPNKYQQCFEAGFYTAPKRNIFPKSFASTGAYLPAITACVQYLYLPPQSEQDARKGPYQPPGR